MDDDFLSREAIIRHRTQYNSCSDFPIGTQVQVITPLSTHWTYYQELGYVVHNDDVKICVSFADKEKFLFDPQDLKVVYRPNCLNRMLNRLFRRK